MSEHTGDEIAVVGLGGRFPAAPDVAALWRNLLDGVDAVHDYTDDELRALGMSESLVADPALVRAAGRLDGTRHGGAAGFDAAFFGVPPAEAALLDPQHRLFLEQAWVALEDAGPRHPDAAVGVFAGCSVNRYFLFHLFGNPAVTGAAADPAGDRERQLVACAAADYLPAQVAYRLGTTGPAVAVQTACSSSLVAVCTAAQSLLDYRCDVALAGGVSVTEPRFRYTPAGLVSPDGRCRAFDAAGQGSGYGSGVAVLALKRLVDALADGDRVYAVLRGWAVNNDGAARAGFAVPGLDGQAAVVAEALAGAAVPAASIGYVEAHGSGTALGDAIEVAALTRAFGREASAGCRLGSIRTNLGNLDAAAGAAALVKAVFAVRDGVIPANLHFDTPNPQIDFAGFEVPVKTAPWPDRGAGPRRAGVSSFGLGGTNAHVIVEEPPPLPGRGSAPEWAVLPVSARTPAALRDAVLGLAGHLGRADQRDGWLLADVARTLADRHAFEHRAVVAARSVPDAVAALERYAAAGRPDDADGAGQYGAGQDGAGGLPDALRAGAEVWLAGGEADPAWSAGGRTVWLPPYPFERIEHWIEAP